MEDSTHLSETVAKMNVICRDVRCIKYYFVRQPSGTRIVNTTCIIIS